jgi:hypothetical protein
MAAQCNRNAMRRFESIAVGRLELGAMGDRLLLVIPAQAGLRRQDAETYIGEADGPKGEPQDAASNPVAIASDRGASPLGPGLRRGDE